MSRTSLDEQQEWEAKLLETIDLVASVNIQIRCLERIVAALREIKCNVGHGRPKYLYLCQQILGKDDQTMLLSLIQHNLRLRNC